MNNLIMSLSDVISGIFVISMAIIVKQDLHITYLFIIHGLMSISTTFFQPASVSILPDIVNSDLLSANSILTTVQKIAQVIGPLLGGILFPLVGVSISFLINGISFIISGISEYFINYNTNTQTNPNNTKDGKGKFLKGFTILKQNPQLFIISLIGGGAVNFFLAPIGLFIPLYIKKHQLPPTMFGIMYSCITIGGLLASVLIYLLKTKSLKVMMAAYLIQGLSVILLGISSANFTALISVTIFGIAITTISITLNTYKQEVIPKEVLGTTQAASMFIMCIAVPIGYLTGGILAEKYDISWLILLTGFSVVIISLLQIILVHRVHVSTSKQSKLSA